MHEDLYKILDKFPTLGQNKFDLREIKSIKELEEILLSLIRSGHVLLHGTPEQIDASLEPRQANDSTRESGNQHAIYATNYPERAIFHAVINKAYLFKKFDDFITGYSTYEAGVLEFEFTKNVKDLIDTGDQEVFCDGYIYALDKTAFKPSEGDDSEYQTSIVAKPLFSVLISKDLGQDIKERSRVC